MAGGTDKSWSLNFSGLEKADGIGIFTSGEKAENDRVVYDFAWNLQHGRKTMARNFLVSVLIAGVMAMTSQVIS